MLSFEPLTAGTSGNPAMLRRLRSLQSIVLLIVPEATSIDRVRNFVVGAQMFFPLYVTAFPIGTCLLRCFFDLIRNPEEEARPRLPRPSTNICLEIVDF